MPCRYSWTCSAKPIAASGVHALSADRMQLRTSQYVSVSDSINDMALRFARPRDSRSLGLHPQARHSMVKDSLLEGQKKDGSEAEMYRRALITHELHLFLLCIGSYRQNGSRLESRSVAICSWSVRRLGKAVSASTGELGRASELLYVL